MMGLIAEVTYESSRIFNLIRTLVFGMKWEFGNGGDRQTMNKCKDAFECLVVPEPSRVDRLF